MPVAGALVSGAIGLWTAKKAGDAQKDAARRSADAIGDSSDAAIAEQRRQFDLTRGDMMPWLDAGGFALDKQRDFLEGDRSGFENSPDYLYARDQMQQGLDRSAASRGRLFSGGYGVDMAQHLNGLAQQNSNSYWNKLAGLSNTGQVTATSLGNFGQNSANSIGNLLMNAGNARASSFQQQGNANANMWGQLGGFAGMFGGLWDQRGGGG